MAKKHEAPTEEAAPAAPVAPVDPIVWFESRENEPSEFDVAGYRATRTFGDGRIYWGVPPDDVERFSKHHHVVTGRVVRRADG